jgi:hypothetical protein
MHHLEGRIKEINNLDGLFQCFRRLTQIYIEVKRQVTNL